MPKRRGRGKASPGTRINKLTGWETLNREVTPDQARQLLQVFVPALTDQPLPEGQGVWLTMIRLANGWQAPAAMIALVAAGHQFIEEEVYGLFRFSRTEHWLIRKAAPKRIKHGK
jgi:hypothetical protein